MVTIRLKHSVRLFIITENTASDCFSSLESVLMSKIVYSLSYVVIRFDLCDNGSLIIDRELLSFKVVLRTTALTLCCQTT